MPFSDFHFRTQQRKPIRRPFPNSSLTIQHSSSEKGDLQKSVKDSTLDRWIEHSLYLFAAFNTD